LGLLHLAVESTPVATAASGEEPLDTGTGNGYCIRYSENSFAISKNEVAEERPGV
jgi:hypothetical protein